MKDIFDTALGIIGDVRVLLFIAFGSAALLYFPASLTPAGAASVIEQHRGWIWAAFIVGLSGLFVRATMAAIGFFGAGARRIAAARKQAREVAEMGEVLRGLTKEEAALVSMFPSIAFHPITVQSNHPVVRGLRYKKVIAHLRGPVMILRRDGYAAHELTDTAQAYLEQHPDTFNHLDRDEALWIANRIMETQMAPYRGVEHTPRDEGWRI